MFTERVKSSFATNEPIYTEEIIGLFPDYSRPQIFRFIREAEEKKEIVNFAKGIYYIPRNTFIGLSTITADTVIARRYLKWNGEVFVYIVDEADCFFIRVQRFAAVQRVGFYERVEEKICVRAVK